MNAGFHTTTNKSKTSIAFSKSPNLSDDKHAMLLPFQRREQLKNLLIIKFMKKYGFKTPEDILEEEVSKFVVSEKLSEKDLRRLDQRIKQIYEERKSQKYLQFRLTTKNKNNPYKSDFNSDNINKDNMSVCSKKSNASQYSNLSNRSRPMSAMSISAKAPGTKLVLQTKRPEPYEQKIGDCYIKDRLNSGLQDTYENKNNPQFNEEEFQGDNCENMEIPQQEDCKAEGNDQGEVGGSDEDKKDGKFEFVGGDEWHAIVEYNHKKYEEDLKLNRLKDLDVKRRQKDHLDLQVREKLIKQQNERIISRDYDNMQDKHILELKEIEKKKEQELKDKTFVLKNSRDILLQNENKRKNQIIQHEKSLEKEQCNFIL